MFDTVLALSWRKYISYRNQSINLSSKSMKWFLYDIDLRHERVDYAFVSEDNFSVNHSREVSYKSQSTIGQNY